DARYQKLFARPPAEGTKSVAGDAQERFVKHIVERLATDGDYAALADRGSQLTAALENLSVAVKKREELYVPEMKAQADRRVALENAQRAYNTMYPQLVLLLGEELAESFFRSLRRTTSSVEPAGTDDQTD